MTTCQEQVCGDVLYSPRANSLEACATMCRAPGDAHMAFDDMEAWLAKHREQAPAGMQSMFQTDTLVPALGWTWMQVST